MTTKKKVGRPRKVGRPKGSGNCGGCVKAGMGWEGFKNFFKGNWSKDALRA